MTISLVKKFVVVMSLLACLGVAAQPLQTPDEIYGELFVDVQMSGVLGDSKTFVDCTPKRDPKAIVEDYETQKGKGVDLQKFVIENFNLPAPPPRIVYIQQEKDVTAHIRNLWSALRREPDSLIPGSSLLPLPYPYIVPGGRFREMYYWDSYFTMLGLREDGNVAIMENMLDNFAYLVETYGHIPNGTRTYYLSRSQPPFFSLMVALLASVKGDDIYLKYLPAMEKEYAFFMDGRDKLDSTDAFRRVVKMPDGSVLNRYWDDNPMPRQESYREDVFTVDTIVMNRMATMRFASEQAMNNARKRFKEEAYRNIRAAAESGIDFSTRWFSDRRSLLTIQTTNYVPVDLNALMFHLEEALAYAYKLKGDKVKQRFYKKQCAQRMAGINKYCYDALTGYYYDYDFVHQGFNDIITPAGMYPFCFFPVKTMKPKMEKAAALLRSNLLADGGILVTKNFSGQQWDAPNGWAPLIWMTTWGLDRCGQSVLAKDIANRWAILNNDVYMRTGKLLEKYNVVDTKLESGGGEYPTQDGFGWTNGVLVALIKKFEITLNH